MTTEAFTSKFDWIRAISDPNSGLTSTQHHVALSLSQHLNITGVGFVTHARLALDTRMSERTVCDALTALADAHWIERTPGKVGRATDYVLTRKFGWQPTPKDELPRQPRRRKREKTPTPATKAQELLAGIYRDTRIDPAQATADTTTTRRLVGVLRRHLGCFGDATTETSKLRAVLTETPLDTANDPAAVLLSRYKKALRLYPQLKPSNAPTGTAQPVIQAALEQLATALSGPGRSRANDQDPR